MNEVETIEVSSLGRNSKIGRNHMFTLLRAKGWISVNSSKATDVAVKNGFIIMKPKQCQSERNPYAVYEIPHLTLKGVTEVLKDLNGMVSYISDDRKRKKIIDKILDSDLKTLFT